MTEVNSKLVSWFCKLIITTIGALSFSSVSYAVDFDEVNYSVYYGDFNGDGNSGDIYLHPDDKIILIHGDIPFPIPVPGGDGYVLYAGGSGQPVVFTLSKSQLSQYTLAALNIDYRLEDSNGDGYTDVIANSVQNPNNKVVFYGASSSSSLPQVATIDGSINLPFFSGDPLATVNNPSNDSLSGTPWYGKTDGGYSVGVDGSFNYSVPILVPAGVQGMQPSLSLDYNSSASNALVGVGWRLTGLSNIRRCKASAVRDGYVSDLKQNYKYCFGGERLVQISSNEYRTEAEDFLKIVKSGDTWQVTNTQGVVTSFGIYSDAKEVDDTGATHTWHLSKVEDIWGNSYSVTYDKGTYSHRPDYITYTENSALPSAPYKVQFNYETRDDRRVSYATGRRQDLDKRLSNVSVLVDGQMVWEYDLNYQQFGQSYNGKTYSDPMKYSRLASVQRCFESGSCQQAIEFDWAERTADSYAYQPLEEGVEASVPPADMYSPTFNRYLEIDLDKDGLIDYWPLPSISSDGDPITITYIYDHDSNPGTGAVDNTEAQPFYQAVDVNGDGYQDVVRISNASEGVKVYLNQADGSGSREISNTASTNYGVAASALTYAGVRSVFEIIWNFPQEQKDVYSVISRTFAYKVIFQDMNNDGLVDIVRVPRGCESSAYVCAYLDPNNLPSNMHTMYNRDNEQGYPSDISVLFNTGSGWQLNNGTPDFVEIYDQWFNWEQESWLQFADINGDGAIDLYGSVMYPQSNDATYFYKLIHNGKLDSQMSYTLVDEGAEGDFGEYITDFNGDGIREVWNPDLSDTDYCMPAGGVSTEWECQLTIVDYNNDGMDDIVEFGNGDGEFNYQVKLSLGADANGQVLFSAPIIIYNTSMFQSSGETNAGLGKKRYFRDVNNDGFLENSSTFKNGLTYNVIERVIDSGGQNVVEVDYLSFADTEIYDGNVNAVGESSQVDAGSDYIVMQRSMLTKRFGVKTLSQTNGVGGVNLSEYSFSGAVYHRGGYGDLGFASREITQNFAGSSEQVRTYTEFVQQADVSYVLAGLLKRKRVYITPENSSEVLISDQRNQWKVLEYNDDYDSGSIDSPHYFPYIYQQSVRTWSLEGQLVSTSRTQNYSGSASCSELSTSQMDSVLTSSSNTEYSTDGVLLYSQKATCDTGGSSSSAYVSASRAENIVAKGDRRGLVERATNYAWVGESLNQFYTGLLDERAVEFNYNNNGSLESKTIAPDAGSSSSMWLKTSYIYSSVGDTEQTTESWHNVANDGLDFNQRSSSQSVVYHGDGTQTITSTQPLVGSTVTVLDAVYGKPTSVTDVNNKVSSTVYDELGRVTLVTHPNNNTTQVDYRSCSSCFSHSNFEAWYSQTKTTGASAQRTYFDAFNRAVGTRSRGWDGNYVYAYKTYDGRGRTKTDVMPFFSGDTQKITTYDYDVLDRVVLTTLPDTNTIQKIYSALQIESINAEGQSQTQYKNAQGWTVKSVDNDNTPVEFEYKPFGELRYTRVNEDDDTVVTVDYDDLGQKTALHDPDAGTTTYSINALGLISSQTDANSIVTRFTYDQLGREKTRTDNATGSARTHTTNYDGQYKGLADSLSGWTTEGDSYSESYTYNTYGQVKTVNAQFLGQNFTLQNGYDNYGRALDVTYPTGYRVASVYDAWGNKAAVVNTADSRSLWAADEANALGQVTEATLGDGSTVTRVYDTLSGRISSITAEKGAQTVMQQSYQFDNIGKLETRTDYESGVTQHFCYDNMNRLTAARFSSCNASSLDFDYDKLGNITYKQGVGNYSYTGARPHAVTGANGLTYSYDSAGNLVQAKDSSNNVVRSVSYSDFNKPTLINNEGKWSNIVYGANKSRVKREDSSGRTTYYFAGIFELSIEGTKTEMVHTLGDFALYIDKIDPISGNEQYHQFLHRDHLGSVVAKTTDVSALTIEREAYDPWGTRLVSAWDGIPFGWSYNKPSSRGFTGHEHLDGVGLIHMNGRVYDPELGRFLSPDPFVQAPNNTQSYNRYAYVFNNPLSFTDPSGYLCMGPSGTWDNFVRSGMDAASSMVTQGAYTMEQQGKLFAGWRAAVASRGGSSNSTTTNEAQAQAEEDYQKLNDWLRDNPDHPQSNLVIAAIIVMTPVETVAAMLMMNPAGAFGGMAAGGSAGDGSAANDTDMLKIYKGWRETSKLLAANPHKALSQMTSDEYIAFKKLEFGVDLSGESPKIIEVLKTQDMEGLRYGLYAKQFSNISKVIHGAGSAAAESLLTGYTLKLMRASGLYNEADLIEILGDVEGYVDNYDTVRGVIEYETNN